jgi:2-amino-4-hydroxy-6-hydroxymethyldihydropteridine diphosphokinase
MRTAVALGSNLGDRLDNLRAARQQIADLPGIAPPILASAIYETDPVDCEPERQNFLMRSSSSATMAIREIS